MYIHLVCTSVCMYIRVYILSSHVHMCVPSQNLWLCTYVRTYTLYISVLYRHKFCVYMEFTFHDGDSGKCRISSVYMLNSDNLQFIHVRSPRSFSLTVDFNCISTLCYIVQYACVLFFCVRGHFFICGKVPEQP